MKKFLLCNLLCLFTGCMNLSAQSAHQTPVESGAKLSTTPFSFLGLQTGFDLTTSQSILMRKIRTKADCEVINSDTQLCTIHGITSRPYLLSYLSQPIKIARLKFSQNRLTSMEIYLAVTPGQNADNIWQQVSLRLTSQYGSPNQSNELSLHWSQPSQQLILSIAQKESILIRINSD